MVVVVVVVVLVVLVAAARVSAGISITVRNMVKSMFMPSLVRERKFALQVSETCRVAIRSRQLPRHSVSLGLSCQGFVREASAVCWGGGTKIGSSHGKQDASSLNFVMSQRGLSSPTSCQRPMRRCPFHLLSGCSSYGA